MENKNTLINGLNKILTMLGYDTKNYNDNELEYFNLILNEINSDLKKIKKNKQEKLKNENIEKSIQLLKDNNIEELMIGYFGIYRKYESAGSKISFDPFDYYEDHYDDGSVDESIFNEIANLLYFLNENYLYNTLNYPYEGENVLYITQKGFEYRPSDW